MLRFVLLASLLAACAQGLTTTISTTIVTSASGETSITTTTSTDSAAVVPAVAAAAAPAKPSAKPSSSATPTAEEIALIRQTWNLVRDNSNVHIRTLTEHFKIHPETQKLFPKFANVPLKDLPNNPDVRKQAYSCVVFGLNFMINNLDNPALLEAALRRVDAYGKWYVEYMSQERQIGETVRIFLQVLEEELGDKLSAEAKAAWQKGMTYAFSFMGSTGKTATGKSILSAEELKLVRSSWPKISGTLNVAENALIKHFVLHPPIQKLYPTLANVPIADLKNTEDFHVQAHTAIKVTNFIVNNLDNDELLRAMLSKVTIPAFFVDYMEPIHQLDETTRLFLEAVDEEFGSSISVETKAAWKKGLDHVMQIMAENAQSTGLDTTVQRTTSDISVKDKALVRNSWSLARRNSNIAPKLFLKMFAAHPETQKMFPRFANLPLEELVNNKDFLNQAYTCLAGLNFMIKNIDDEKQVAAALRKMASPSFYVGGPSPAEQLEETNKFLMEAMKEELGSAFTAEDEAAWTNVLNYINGVLAQAEEGASQLKKGDVEIMRDDIAIIGLNKNAGANMFIKLFKAHPSTIQLFPKFVSVPLAELPQNRDFQAYGNMVMSGLNFMVENIENPSLMKQLMCAQGIDKYFVQGVSITQQLQETARIVIEWVEEEMGDRFTSTTKGAWTRGTRVLNNVMAECL